LITEPDVLAAFLLVSISLTLLPGPDNLFVLSLSAIHGSRTGIPAALGMAIGNFAHTTAVALGLSALVASTPFALTLVQALGVVYLLFLAWQSWHHPLRLSNDSRTPAENQLSSLQLFRRGLLMNLLNPKVALFFLALFPQFIDQNSVHKALQIFTLGTVFVLQTAIIFSAVALAAGRLQPFILRLSPKFLAGLTSGLFVMLSIYLARANF
jgi:threonine/homoserine/homoserine lactone efflux protein